MVYCVSLRHVHLGVFAGWGIVGVDSHTPCPSGRAQARYGGEGLLGNRIRSLAAKGSGGDEGLRGRMHDISQHHSSTVECQHTVSSTPPHLHRGTSIHMPTSGADDDAIPNIDEPEAGGGRGKEDDDDVPDISELELNAADDEVCGSPLHTQFTHTHTHTHTHT